MIAFTRTSKPTDASYIIEQRNRRGKPERGGMTGAFSPCPFKRGATGAEVLFHNRIIGNFMVFEDRLETNLLQLFAHPENSERFS